MLFADDFVGVSESLQKLIDVVYTVIDNIAEQDSILPQLTCPVQDTQH